MLNDWKREAMEYRDVDREAQRKAEEAMKQPSEHLAAGANERPATHTPGPWHVESSKPARFPAYRVNSATDRYICDVFIMANNPASDNARLIAAAPDLLTALERISKLSPNELPDGKQWTAAHCLGQAQEIADAALSSVKGKA